MKYELYKLERTLKIFLAVFLVTQFTGVLVGLIYLEYTTKYSPENAVTRYKGTDVTDEFAIPDEYAKPISEMLITTHNHIIGFSTILFTSGIIFYFNSIISGFWKKFILIEPLLSAVISFGSLWLVRFVHDDFIYLTVASAILLYTSYLIMTAVSLYELIMKKNIHID
jgi:hypothetical protein